LGIFIGDAENLDTVLIVVGIENASDAAASSNSVRFRSAMLLSLVLALFIISSSRPRSFLLFLLFANAKLPLMAFDTLRM
jgi:hypothetical protein